MKNKPEGVNAKWNRIMKRLREGKKIESPKGKLVGRVSNLHYKK